jgi:hypothetical protein
MHAGKTNQNTHASVVTPYYAVATISFFVASVLVLLSSDSFFGHYFQPRLLAITHIMALGWGTMCIFGALFQFLPVLLEVPLFSGKLAKITFFLMLGGIPLLIFSFWNFKIGWPLQSASVIISAAVFTFFINILKTVNSARINNVAADFISVSSFWLLITVIAGTLLVFNLSYLFLPQSHLLYLKVHAHLGIVGWFILLIIGVSSRLIPMFLLSSNTNTSSLSWSYYLINTGLISFSADLLIANGSILQPLFVLLIVAGLIVYILFIRRAYKTRVRKILDVGLRQSMLAFLALLVPLVLAIILSLWRETEKQFLTLYVAYGFAIFFGFISTLILGQVFKTLPFIVWMKKYENYQGPKILPKDLYSEKLAKYQFIIHGVSIAILLVAIIFKLKLLFIPGAILLLLSALLFNFNTFKILSHLFLKKDSHELNHRKQ